MQEQIVKVFIEDANKEEIDRMRRILLSGLTFYRAMVVEPGTVVEDFRFGNGQRLGYHDVMSLAFKPETCLPELGYATGKNYIEAGKVLAFQVYKLTQNVDAYDVAPLNEYRKDVYNAVLSTDGEGRRKASIILASGLSTNPNAGGSGSLPIVHPSVSGIAARIDSECMQYSKPYHEAHNTTLCMTSIFLIPPKTDLTKLPSFESLTPLSGNIIPPV